MRECGRERVCARATRVGVSECDRARVPAERDGRSWAPPALPPLWKEAAGKGPDGLL